MNAGARRPLKDTEVYGIDDRTATVLSTMAFTEIGCKKEFVQAGRKTDFILNIFKM